MGRWLCLEVCSRHRRPGVPWSLYRKFTWDLPHICPQLPLECKG